MNKLLIYSLALFFSLSAFSQNLNFESIVVEEDTSEPVDNALVAIEKTDLIVKTNKEGVFKFTSAIPNGEYVITVSKDGYETAYFYINAEENKQILVDKIVIKVTKAEAKRRKNKAKEEAKKLKEAKKAKKAKDKLIAKKEKKLKKKNSVDVVYYDTTKINTSNPTPEVTETIVITETQLKYSKILDVPVETLTNKDLYDFIQEWEGTPYLWGGETKEGIDCSSFTQRLYSKAYDKYIERTALKQKESKYTDPFKGKEYLKEGDLIFFKGVGPDNSNEITHVGVYLHNNKFVHATSSKRTEGVSGVKISDLTDNYWSIRFVTAGRRINQ